MSPLPVVTDVVRVALGWSLHPERAALLVRDDPRPFALIGRWAGGGALIGSDPVRVAGEHEDPFGLLDQQPMLPPALAGSPAIGGGWFGWLGYGLGARLEAVSPPPPSALAPASFELAFYDHLLRQDADGRWFFEALWSEARDRALRARLQLLRDRAADPPEPRPFSTEEWSATPSRTGHALAVTACRERIEAGDLFQANICARLQSRLSGSALDLFAAGSERLQPDRAAFFQTPAGAIASLSPELFLERHRRQVLTAPIKGTRPRPADPAQAAEQRHELETSAKDRAENVMIVDLMRNDLGRVCEPGSIDVQALCQARAHTGVWHLVSEVAGVLREGVGDAALLRAAFPPGSVTGAPKLAAIDVIAELESTSRGLYTGAVGFASPLGGLELSVAIRTFEFAGERAWLGVGGGIVAESDPLAEADECVTKAAPLLSAIGARLAADRTAPGRAGAPPRQLDRTAPGRAGAPPPRRLAPRPVPRPDPVAGVFETLLIAGGRAVALERHLERLRRSVRELYRASLPSGLEDQLNAAAAEHDAARMRVDVRPCEAGLRAAIELTPLAPRSVPVDLRARTLPGGVGAHKYSDRRLLAALSEDAGAEPLLCDLDGFVLEAARASVFVVERSGVVLTPPADGRILPGVTRARVLELARDRGYETRTEPIELTRLAAAEEIFVTGALGGVEPAVLADLGGAWTGAGAVTSELAQALRADRAADSDKLVQMVAPSNTGESCPETS